MRVPTSSRTMSRLVDIISGGQRNNELRPIMVCRVFDPKPATVRLNDAVRNRQSHASAGRLAIADVSVTHGAEELFEYSLPHVLANAWTLVFDAQQNGTVIFRSRANSNRCLRRRIFCGVVDQRVDNF